MTVAPHQDSSSSWRTDALVAGALGVVAFAARAAVAANIPESPPVFDMQEYWDRGVFIFEHGRLYDNSWRTPGYPEALAAAFRLASGPSLSAAHWLNVAAGTVATLLTYWLARRTAAIRAASVATLVVALYPSFLIHTAFVATETVVMVPLLAALIAVSYRTRSSALVAGAAAALTALTRPAGIALLPAILIALIRGRSASRPDAAPQWNVLLPTLAMTAFVVAMVPWWIHNAKLHGRFIPLDTGFGFNIFIGNGPLASGLWKSNVLAELQPRMLQGIDWTTPSGSDRMAAMTAAHVRAHPLDTLRLVPTKLLGLLSLEGREHAYLYSWSYFGPIQPRLVWLWGVATLVVFPCLLVAALAGVAVTRGVASRVAGPCLLFLLTTLAMHMALFGESRYHLPLVPVLVVLATGVARWRTGVRPWALASGLAVVLWLGGPWAAQWSTLWTALPTLAAPAGWNSRLVYDDLLW